MDAVSVQHRPHRPLAWWSFMGRCVQSHLINLKDPPHECPDSILSDDQIISLIQLFFAHCACSPTHRRSWRIMAGSNVTV